MHNSPNQMTLNNFQPRGAAIHPTVADKVDGREMYFDIYSRLLKERIVFVLGQVEDNMANSIVSQLLYLEADDAQKPIHLYINSPGGSVTAGLAIYDTMNSITCPVYTYVMGQACSMGAFLLSAGDKRFAMRSARIMIHQPLGGYQGQATDMEIHMEEMLRLKVFLNEVLADNTGHTYQQIVDSTERDNFMSAVEAKQFGLVDEVIEFKEGASPEKRRPCIPCLQEINARIKSPVKNVKPTTAKTPRTPKK
jgi:ATP-dependent Clp protease protease subunit